MRQRSWITARLSHCLAASCTAAVAPAESLFQQTSAVTQAFDDAYREQQDFLQVVKELQQLCTFTHIKGSGNARGDRLRPCVAVGVDLLSGGRGRTAREGTVKFTVSTCALWISRE